jgi:tRNA(fMet)-specific endonuclease VapC
VRCLWDTDIVSEYLRARNAIIVQKGQAYLGQYGQAEFSLITRFEVLRGWKAKNAVRKLAVFEAFCQSHLVLSIEGDIITLAADLWAALKRKGQLIGDNDLIIAATALHHGLGVATRNVAHFNRIPGLVVEDWSKP